jgi:arabinan endo-1,5-alpha-L-arabinosidase
LLLVCLVVSLLVGCAYETGEAKFANPVYEPVLADPSIIKAEDGYFYAYGTEDAWGEESQTKLVPIVRSSNLLDWEYIGEAFEKKPNWKGSGNIWAPDITYFHDKYYLFYSLSIWGDSDPGIGVAISEDPEGPFDDKGKVFTSEEIGVANSIDPYFMINNEKPYLVWGSFHGIYGIELSNDGLATNGEKFKLAGNSYEAPYISEKDGYYYFFGSRGSCCDGANSTYNIAVGRSEKFEGPYIDQEGIPLLNDGGNLILESNPKGSFVGPGHNAIISDDNHTDWLIYHAIDKEEPLLWTGASRRPLLMDPIIWVDGWPSIRGEIPNDDSQPAPVVK